MRIPIEQVREGDTVLGQRVAAVQDHGYIRLVMESHGTIDSFRGHVIEVEREGE